MTTPPANLFDEVCARLPLFEDLPPDAPACLAAAGFGRGLLTASVRSRLRKAGFADMGALALATPAELTRVRKIGPVRLDAIRAHVLDELARIFSDARATHAAEATAARRLDRLHTMSANRLGLAGDALSRLGCAHENAATLAMLERRACLRTGRVEAADLDRIVGTLADVLLQERPRPSPPARQREGETPEEAAREARARLLREQDRDWEEAAPPGAAEAHDH